MYKMNRDKLYPQAYFQGQYDEKKSYVKKLLEELQDEAIYKTFINFIAVYVHIWMEMYDKLTVLYSAGLPIMEMREDMPTLIEMFVKYVEANINVKKKEHKIKEIDTYKDYIQILSWLICLKVEKKYIKMFSDAVGQEGKDKLLDELFVKAGVYDRKVGDILLYPKVYESLYNALKTNDNTEKKEQLQFFVKNWYKGFRSAIGWYGFHKPLKDREYPIIYLGYWAFEASAVAYLNQIDDRDMKETKLYAYDLTEFARINKF
jgi:hypothetical protein